ncbi:hypothetical protein GJ496_006837 [Pomphorhynchus laevis]|nr:hypothetical protein GJ496_006837 [Pomphorhynchus laevis]
MDKRIDKRQYDGNIGRGVSPNSSNLYRASDSIWLDALYNHVTPNIYSHISDANLMEYALSSLDQLYVNLRNEVFARHKLNTLHQRPDESIDKFIQTLE